jgi:hypothetical protein
MRTINGVEEDTRMGIMKGWAMDFRVALRSLAR